MRRVARSTRHEVGTVPSEGGGYARTVAPSSGQRLLRYDRRLGVRFVAGADEAGRGSLAGPLVVAGVLLDYEALRGHRVRSLATLNDSKQVEPAERERLFHAVLSAASAVAVRVISASEIDRRGLHRSNLRGLRVVLAELRPPAEACLVDGFRLGPLAPPHTAVVDGDTKSAAIAAASIVAKVTRDRLMRRVDALYPRYGFSSHVGYITPAHTRAVLDHGPCPQHRRSFQSRAYLAA
jgi:ribonuclease HII